MQPTSPGSPTVRQVSRYLRDYYKTYASDITDIHQWQSDKLQESATRLLADTLNVEDLLSVLHISKAFIEENGLSDHSRGAKLLLDQVARLSQMDKATLRGADIWEWYGHQHFYQDDHDVLQPLASTMPSPGKFFSRPPTWRGKVELEHTAQHVTRGDLTDSRYSVRKNEVQPSIVVLADSILQDDEEHEGSSDAACQLLKNALARLKHSTELTADRTAYARPDDAHATLLDSHHSARHLLQLMDPSRLLVEEALADAVVYHESKEEAGSDTARLDALHELLTSDTWRFKRSYGHSGIAKGSFACTLNGTSTLVPVARYDDKQEAESVIDAGVAGTA